MVQCSQFHSRFRKPGEIVAMFVSELHLLAEFCNFGTSLDDMLRDRLICGSYQQQQHSAERRS